jgi:flagella basal body P-ring formation protein FlgA
MRNLLIMMTLLFTLLPGVVPAATGETQLISQAEIAEVLNDYLAEASVRLPRVELRFASIALPKPFEVPQGKIEFQVIPAKPDVIGSRRLTLLTRVAGQVVSNQSIRVELEALAEIAIAADNLHRGDLLSEENVSLQQQDITKLKQPLFATDEIYGKRLKRSLRLGRPLLRRQVEFPPMIKRGERVTIKALRAGLVLTAAGEAQQDGRQDETIRVLNSGSRKVVLCRVVAPALVTVEF